MMKLKTNPIYGADMAKKILINLSAYRSGVDNNQSPAEAVLDLAICSDGLKTLREQAVFRFTCRKCTDAPCVVICPTDALGKDTDGMITRAINLCVSCKSCVVICPFGTLMTDFFRFKTDKSRMVELIDENTWERFIRESPEGSVEIVEQDENHEHQIYKLNEKVLVRELIWDSENF
jgi:Fe-S-cluster-containing hydrogenase component 2